MLTIMLYHYGNRDALLCTILDGVRASGNRDVCVKMSRTNRGHRLGPFSVAVEEDVESQYLRYLTNQPQGVLFSEAVERFNANIAYSGLNHAVSAEGLFAENKEKLITSTLQALLQREGIFRCTHTHTHARTRTHTHTRARVPTHTNAFTHSSAHTF